MSQEVSNCNSNNKNSSIINTTNNDNNNNNNKDNNEMIIAEVGEKKSLISIKCVDCKRNLIGQFTPEEKLSCGVCKQKQLITNSREIPETLKVKFSELPLKDNKLKETTVLINNYERYRNIT